MLTRRDLLKAFPLVLSPKSLSALQPISRQGGDLPAESLQDSRFEKLCREYCGRGLPAVWIAVADRGRLLGASCMGYQNWEGHVAANLADRVGYGSITKPFTGLMISTLVAEGLLSYDRPVVEYLPSLSAAFEGERQFITLGHLVTHMAGFPPGPPEPKQRFTDGSAYRRQFALNGLAQPLIHPVGTTYAYSNIDITIASLAAEAVTGKSWERLLRERVTDPLGIPSISPHPIKDDRSFHCYEQNEIGIVDTIEQSAIQRNWFGPAGSLQGTIIDLLKFGIAFLDARTLPPPIDRSGIYPKLTHAAPGSKMSYCAISCQERPKNNFRLAHGGSLVVGRYRGFANLRVNSEQGRAVAIATNIYGYGEESKESKQIGALIEQMNFEVESYL